jgi:predicted nicotinamide N-methyase
MDLFDIPTPVVETKLVWARTGKNKLVRKFRCVAGKRAGRVVGDPSQCHLPIDVLKKFKLKQTKAKLGSRMLKKSLKTKKYNPISKLVQRLNK